MLEREEKIIDFEVYKYAAPNIYHMVALMLVLLVTLMLYVVCLPFIWFTPTQKLFRYSEYLINELT